MRRYWVTIVGALVVALVPCAAWATPPATPAFGAAPVDPYGAFPLYQCDAVDPHRAGAEGFRSMVGLLNQLIKGLGGLLQPA